MIDKSASLEGDLRFWNCFKVIWKSWKEEEMKEEKVYPRVLSTISKSQGKI